MRRFGSTGRSRPWSACACPRATGPRDDDSGTLLEIEDLSVWSPGADPAAAARLASVACTGAGSARQPERWPWLRPLGAGVDLVEQLFTETWPSLTGRGDLTPAVASFGARMAEPGRLTAVEEAIAEAGPLTLVHGDAQARNMRTSPDGEVALLDWEDVSAAPGVLDLAWLLTASVDPGQLGRGDRRLRASQRARPRASCRHGARTVHDGGHSGRLAGGACTGEPARRGLPASVLIGRTLQRHGSACGITPVAIPIPDKPPRASRRARSTGEYAPSSRRNSSSPVGMSGADARTRGEMSQNRETTLGNRSSTSMPRMRPGTCRCTRGVDADYCD